MCTVSGHKLCPCYTGYVIVTNTVTLVRNEFRPFVACAYTIERACACMHLDPGEFACVHTHKCKRSFLRAFACMHLRACSRAGLIKMQKRVCAEKKDKSKRHFGFRNFQDVLYQWVHSNTRIVLNFADFPKNALFKSYGIICLPRAAPAS